MAFGCGVERVAQLYRDADAINIKLSRENDTEVGDVETLWLVVEVERLGAINHHTRSCHPEWSCPGCCTCDNLHIHNLAKRLCVAHLEV